MIAVIVVIINVVIHDCFYLAEFRGAPEPAPDVVLHMAEEAFLWSVVPAVSLSGHGLAQALVAEYFNKAVACIMAPLVAVQDCGQVRKGTVVRKIGDVRKQHHSGPITFELALQQVLRDIAVR